MVMSRIAEELRITRRAASIFFGLGLVSILPPYDKNDLMIYWNGLPFWGFIAWAACAAYASILSWRKLSSTSLRALSVLAFCHLSVVFVAGIFHPRGYGYLGPAGWVGSVMDELWGTLFFLVGWRGMPLAMVVLAFFVSLKSLAQPTSRTPQG